IESNGLFGALEGVAVPLADFKKLTQIPIIIYYGDNIASQPTEIWTKDHWRAGLEMARKWAHTVNKHGGDATVVHLPEVGNKDYTPLIMSVLHHVQIADWM